MKCITLGVCALLVCAASTSAQITQITAATLVSPVTLDFDTMGAPAAGPVVPTDPYFQSIGLCDINIINAPGMHNAAGDLLSSGFIGNCLASVNNSLAIVAPNGPMDNHMIGAGWSFRLDPGLIATQFGCIITDQTNHSMTVETWFAGALQNTFTFTMANGFPNPYIYFEDLMGFDEVRFMNPATNGGWGIDDFTLAGVTGAVTGIPCPAFPPPPYQINTSEGSMTISGIADPGGFAPIIKSAAINTPETVDLATTNVGVGWDIALEVGGATVPSVFITPGNQVVNMNLAGPLTFVNGGATWNIATTSFPAATLQLPFSISTTSTAAAQAIFGNPTAIDGFTLSHACEYSAETCNASQDFEAVPNGLGAAPVGWANGAAGQGWTIDTAGTTSVGTGPTSGNGGSLTYAYCETSGFTGVTFTLDTCFNDLTSIPGVTGTVNFALSRIGATIGTLEILVDDGTGTGFVPVTDLATGTPVTYIGADPAQAQGASEWSMESVPFLHNIASSNATIRFQYTSGTSFTGDLAIDDVVIN